MSETDIYYFTGAGNSLHAAKELSKRLPETRLIPIVGLLDRRSIKTEADTVGFVFPCHGLTVPVPVRRLMRRIDARSASYVFGIVTRTGTSCDAVEEILEKRCGRLDAFVRLNMADNDPKTKQFFLRSPEQLAEIESDLQTRLDSLAQAILSGQRLRTPDDNCLYKAGPVLDRLVRFGAFYADVRGIKDYFYTDANCSGCGICANVCPNEKVRMEDGKPLWQRDVDCYLCYACVNFCPQASVQIKSSWFMKSYTEERGRYTHPDVKLKDMIAQRGQDG